MNGSEIIDRIYEQRYLYTYEMAREPNSVLIHPVLKRTIGEYVFSSCSQVFNLDTDIAFGMKVFWSQSISEDQIICFFDINRK